MAKKTRRARLSATQRYVPTPGAPALEQTGAPVARAEAPTRGPSALSSLKDEETFAYIRADLKRIGILAGSILAFLVALRLLVIR